MQAATVVTVQPPGPVTIAPYARSIQLHFRWTAILAALLHVGLLVLFAGKGVTRLAVAIISIAYFLLFLNLLVLARVGWSLFSARTRTTAGLLLLAALASLLLWMLADVNERLPSAIAYPAAVLAALAWIGVLVLLQGVVANADGIVEDAFRRSSSGASVRAFVPAPQGPGAASQAVGQVATAGLDQLVASAPVILPAPPAAQPVIVMPSAAAAPAAVPAVPAAVSAVPAAVAAPAPQPPAAPQPLAAPQPPAAPQAPAAVRSFWQDWFKASPSATPSPSLASVAAPSG
jgi:hypothetical protein